MAQNENYSILAKLSPCHKCEYVPSVSRVFNGFSFKCRCEDITPTTLFANDMASACDTWNLMQAVKGNHQLELF